MCDKVSLDFRRDFSVILSHSIFCGIMNHRKMQLFLRWQNDEIICFPWKKFTNLLMPQLRPTKQKSVVAVYFSTFAEYLSTSALPCSMPSSFSSERARPLSQQQWQRIITFRKANSASFHLFSSTRTASSSHLPVYSPTSSSQHL